MEVNEKIRLYLLFGAFAFATGGMCGVAYQSKTNLLGALIRVDTIYYFLTLFIILCPIFMLVSYMRERKIELKPLACNAALYSYLLLGSMVSVSNTSSILGPIGTILMGFVVLLYIGTLLSIKVIEDPDENKK